MVARMFKHEHAMSIHLNAIAILATVCYGVSLSTNVLTESVESVDLNGFFAF